VRSLHRDDHARSMCTCLLSILNGVCCQVPFPLLWKAQTLRERYCVAWCEVHEEDLDCHLGNMDDMLENEMDESDELRGLVHEVNNSS
jgi:hypothetical protein